LAMTDLGDTDSDFEQHIWISLFTGNKHKTK